MQETAPGVADFSLTQFPSPTGAVLALRHLAAAGKAIGAVQINHGAAEHSARYRE